MRKYVVTGATGMIGIALVNAIIERGDCAIALIRPDSARSQLLPCSERLTVHACGLDDYRDFVPDERADAMIHLAWAKTSVSGRDDLNGQLDNVRYALDAAELAARYGCEAFVGAGSQAEYGLATEPLRGDTPANPESGYGIAKFAAGRFTHNRCTALGIRHCWARILSVYGAHDGAHTLISYLLETLQARQIPALTPCEQIWDYMHCTDAAAALLAIADRGVHGKAYCLGSGEARPLKDWIKDVRDLTAPDVKLGFGQKEYYPHQPMFLAADITELTRDTGFQPRVRFEDGITNLIKKPRS